MSVRLNPPGWATQSIGAFRWWLSMDLDARERHYPTGEEHQLQHRPEWLDEIKPLEPGDYQDSWTASGEIES